MGLNWLAIKNHKISCLLIPKYPLEYCKALIDRCNMTKQEFQKKKSADYCTVLLLEVVQQGWNLVVNLVILLYEMSNNVIRM